MICSRSAIEQEDDGWRSDEFCDEEEKSFDEKSPEECLTDLPENDETNLIPLKCTATKNYCKAQGMTDGDLVHLDREVREMLETVRSLQTTLSEDGRFDRAFGVESPGERESGKGGNGEKDVKACIEEIEKMEAVLRAKAAEERSAKLCRIQAEEESRDVLDRLPCVEVSNGIKLNMEEFKRLLNDVEGTEADSLCVEKLDPAEGPGGEEKKRENRTGEQRKTKSLRFVEKNIQLAKCGRGTLSLTDEEKLRIEELLLEAEDSGERPRKGGHSKEVYAIDDETKSVLSKIDERLQAVTEGRSAELCKSKMSLFEKCGNEGNGKAVEKKRRNRLAEINKLLNDVKSVSHEEVSPLSEEEIESLLEESRRSLCKGRSVVGDEDEEGEKGGEDLSRISELVSSAKLLMPKFKYRFDES